MPAQHDHPFELLIDEEALAERIGIAPRTLQKWRYEGGGPPYFKLNSAVRYRLSEVLEWLEDRRRTSTSDHAVSG